MSHDRSRYRPRPRRPRAWPPRHRAPAASSQSDSPHSPAGKSDRCRRSSRATAHPSRGPAPRGWRRWSSPRRRTPTSPPGGSPACNADRPPRRRPARPRARARSSPPPRHNRHSQPPRWRSAIRGHSARRGRHGAQGLRSSPGRRPAWNGRGPAGRPYIPSAAPSRRRCRRAPCPSALRAWPDQSERSPLSISLTPRAGQ